jgi:HK97 family phage portal protein
MSLLFRRRQQQRDFTIPASAYLPIRVQARPGTSIVSTDTAMRHSAVWSCLRLRANLISTMPVDVYRKVGGIQVTQPTVISPGGDKMDIEEWLYSSQIDLDRSGNVFGLITERWHVGNLPSTVELVPLSEVSLQPNRDQDVVGKNGQPLKYRVRIAGTLYDPADVWHEKQYTVPGLPLGLSPIAYAAWSIGEYLSIMDFALDWFGNGGVPGGHLRNVAKTITPDDATTFKERFKASNHAGDVFVSGADWEYKPIQSESAGVAFLEAKKYSIGDIARFFDCPGDLIDAAVQSGNITYANVTQRNLQFLIMHLGPAVIRRERALGKFLPQPVFVKFNTNALLRMDPTTQAQVLTQRINQRSITPDEIREMYDQPPLTEDQVGQLLTFFPPSRSVETGLGLEQPPVAPTESGAI